MNIATQKLEIIKLILFLEDEKVLAMILEYLEAQKQTAQNPEPSLSADKSSRLLTEYEEKIAEVETDEEMQAVFAQYSEEELFRIMLRLRAKEARENRHLGMEASEFFASRRERRKNKSHVE